jgi:xanthine dehydrogenase accessory factor
MSNEKFPLDLAPLGVFLTSEKSGVLAVIINVEGPSYRPVGAVMAIFEDGSSTGSLSSGCVEADIKLNAQYCLKSGSPSVVKYGRGSPYLDIVLACGGGLEILLIPSPCREVIGKILKVVVSDRQACAFEINTDTGKIVLSSQGAIGLIGSTFRTVVVPELRFLVFGQGPEAVTFAALSQATGFGTTLLSPDPATLQSTRGLSCETFELTRSRVPNSISVDSRTAIVLFFHDHDWELGILADTLATSAFYIGAQGSLRARDNRLAALSEQGFGEVDLARLHGPIGLINSAKDPRTLAISVLAEIVSFST